MIVMKAREPFYYAPRARHRVHVSPLAKSTFEQTRVNPNEEPTEGYSLLSAGLGGSFEVFGNELLLQISGKNLLNKTYFSHLSRLKVDGIANMGRNISVSLQLEL